MHTYETNSSAEMKMNTLIEPKHLRDFGLVMLGRSLKSCCVRTDSQIPPYEDHEDFENPIITVQTAHGTELIIKARIAEEHPLLVFSKLPRLKPSDKSLTAKKLFEEGKY